MAIDPYSPCPCGSGKKLKFCCTDLAADIEKVHEMVAGEQPHAALRHVEQLLKKQPDRASLLDLRASLELSLHEFDAARKTVDAFLAAHPQSATAHAQQAILTSVQETGSKSVAPLQDALEQLGDDMPLRVLEAIGAVGQALLLEGELVAARGHLLLYAGIAPEGDNRALELLLRMNMQAGLPLLMREYLSLAECPPEVEWQDRFDEASKLSGRGLWRRAEGLLAPLREEVGPVPEVVYNLAVLRGWLGQSAAFAAGLHEYALLDVALDNAVEAEALAQIVDPELQDPTIDTVKLVYPVPQIDALVERLATDRRVEDYPLDLQGNEELATRPRSSHMLLDRPTPSSGVDLDRSEVPNVVAFLILYGKRTDREARLEVTTDRGDTFDEVQALLAEVVGDTIGELVEDEVLVQKSISEESLSWRWRLPDDTPPDHRRKLLSEQRREAILTRWTAAPRAALANKSPLEAVGDESLRIALLASALIIQQAAADPGEQSLFSELRQRLQLPPLERIDPTGLDLEHLPIVRVPRLELSKIADDQLAKLLDRTVLMGANFATLLVAAELVGRTQLAEGVDPTSAYRQLIRLEVDHQRAFDWVAKACDWSRSHDQSTAQWMLMALELAIQCSDGQRAQDVLNKIRENHINEPGVIEATVRILSEAGLLAPPSTQGGPTREPSPAASGNVPPPAGGQGIWTPGDAPDAETADSGSKPAIWTP